MNINVIKSQKHALLAKTEAIAQSAIDSGRGMNKDEKKQYDENVATIQALGQQISLHAENAGKPWDGSGIIC